MTEKFKILGQYIKDMSSETKDIETYIFVKDKISKYELDININSKPLKNKMVEINTTLKFEDKDETKHKSHFEMTYATIIKVDQVDKFQAISDRDEKKCIIVSSKFVELDEKGKIKSLRDKIRDSGLTFKI